MAKTISHDVTRNDTEPTIANIKLNLITTWEMSLKDGGHMSIGNQIDAMIEDAAKENATLQT